jgi:DNA end-binding protein Ku
MARVIWKGSISFGLVNIPVELHSGEARQELGLHLLDARNQGRIRYMRVNEETGEEVPWDAIVRGYEYEGGKYVLLSDEELDRVKAEVTKTVEIEDFVELREIEPVYFDKPYFLVPQKGQRTASKGYALLRQTLRQSGKVGIARVVIRSREYLCAVMVRGDMILLNVLRFADELRDAREHTLPGNNLEELKISPKEVELATKLVDAMSGPWEPERYKDNYREALKDWIEEKISKAEFGVSTDKPVEEPVESRKVVELTDYLKRSVEEAERKAGARSRSGSGREDAKASKASRKKTPHRRKAG